MARSGNPLPSSGHTTQAIRKAGQERTAEIERQAWAGYLAGIPTRTLAAQIDCSKTAVADAINRLLEEWHGDLPPSQQGRVMAKVASLQAMRARLALRIQNGEVLAIREARRLIEQEAKLLDLFPDRRVEVTGSGGGPITFAQVPMEDRAAALRAAGQSAIRHAAALEVQGHVVEPKALPAAKKPVKKPAVKKGQTKGTKRAPKSKVKQADQPKRKTVSRTSKGET